MRLEPTAIVPSAIESMKRFHPEIVEAVKTAIARDRIVVVGMAQNPFVKKARHALRAAGYEFTYIEHGSYLSKWKERLAIKLWSGWPTFPQVYVRGKLLGGADDTIRAIADGSFAQLLSQPN